MINESTYSWQRNPEWFPSVPYIQESTTNNLTRFFYNYWLRRRKRRKKSDWYNKSIGLGIDMWNVSWLQNLLLHLFLFLLLFHNSTLHFSVKRPMSSLFLSLSVGSFFFYLLCRVMFAVCPYSIPYPPHNHQNIKRRIEETHWRHKKTLCIETVCTRWLVLLPTAQQLTNSKKRKKKKKKENVRKWIEWCGGRHPK